MPWDIVKNKDGSYTVTSKVSGRTAHVKSKKNLKGYLYHASQGKDKGKK
jgi:hypothetical protein